VAKATAKAEEIPFMLRCGANRNSLEECREVLPEPLAERFTLMQAGISPGPAGER